MSSYTTKYEEDLREIISRKIPHCRIIPTNARFRFIKSKQTWLDLKCWNKITLKGLTFPIPIMGILSSEDDIKIFNFGNDYKKYENHFAFEVSSVSTIKVIWGRREYLFFANYPLFGNIENRLNTHFYSSFETIKQHWLNYGLDFYIWLSNISLAPSDFYISFAIVQNDFIFKGPFLMHKIDPQSEHLTLSFLVSLVEILEKFKNLGLRLYSLKNLFYNKIELLDYLDIHFFKPCFDEKKIEYEPLLGAKNCNYRLERIKRKLQNL